ncbi:MAG TPA: hypothetical protein PK095_22995, partial [Myxococcota bacterium]|nr:hypothetical protein [Myxococcota bacterium]
MSELLVPRDEPRSRPHPRVVRLGRLSWPDALAVQERARDEVLAGAEDRTYLLEHDPVVTLGKRGGVVDTAALTPPPRIGIVPLERFRPPSER